MTDPSAMAEGQAWLDANPAAGPRPLVARCETGGCIAVTYEADRVHITETERPDETITTSRTNWDTFTAAVKAGKFDDLAAGDE